MVVHLYGQVCWSQELEDLAHKYNLKIIEDNAQAAGAMIAQSSEHRAQGKNQESQSSEHRAQGKNQESQSSVLKNPEPCALSPVPVASAAPVRLVMPQAIAFIPGKNLGALGDAGAVNN